MTPRPASPAPPWQDLDLVLRAGAEATRLHGGDRRKGTDIPYAAHLWSVAALVLEHGGDDTQVAAAFLHDAAEDHGGLKRLEAIREEFGPEVAELVDALSDSLADTDANEIKAPWLERKQAYLARLAGEDQRALLVSACDKLHNARTIVADYRLMGLALWAKFNEQRPEGQLWYYRSLVAIYERRQLRGPTFELRRVIEELSELVARDDRDFPSRLTTLEEVLG